MLIKWEWSSNTNDIIKDEDQSLKISRRCWWNFEGENSLFVEWEPPYTLRTDVFYVLEICVILISCLMCLFKRYAIYNFVMYPPMICLAKGPFVFENPAPVSPTSGIFHRLEQRNVFLLWYFYKWCTFLLLPLSHCILFLLLNSECLSCVHVRIFIPITVPVQCI